MSEAEGQLALAQVKALTNYIDEVLSRPRRKHEDSEEEHITLTNNEQEKLATRFELVCDKLRALHPAVFSDLMMRERPIVTDEIELQEMRSELTYCVDTLEHIIEHNVGTPTSVYEWSDTYSKTNKPFSQEEQRLLAERVDEVEAFMVKAITEDKGETPEAEILKEFIKTEITEVKERLTTVGRRDWKMFFLNTILSIGISAGFSAEARIVISQYLITIISIIQHSKLLNP
jgi:hypothetical protein